MIEPRKFGASRPSSTVSRMPASTTRRANTGTSASSISSGRKSFATIIRSPACTVPARFAAGDGGVERVGDARFKDDLLAVVLDRLGADAGQNLALEPRKLRVGHQFEHAVARLDRVAHDPCRRLVEVVAVLAHQRDDDRVERARG